MDDKEFLATTLPPTRWAVQGLIPEGFTIFAGMEKVGKSSAMMGMAASVADGTPAFGRYTVQRGGVIYLALEDPAAVTQERLAAIYKSRKEGPNGLLRIETQWPAADQGGLEDLELMLEDFPETRLVVIDVLREFLPVSSRYNQASKDIGELNRLALRHHVALVGVHHMYRGGLNLTSDNWKDKIQGSVGARGAATTIIGLARPDNRPQGLMRVTGKVVEAQSIAMVFDYDKGGWRAEESGGSIADPVDDPRQLLYAVVEANPGINAVDVAAWIPNSNYDAIRRLLWSMAKVGQLVRREGRYFTPEQIEEMEKPDDNPQLGFTERPEIRLEPPLLAS